MGRLKVCVTGVELSEARSSKAKKCYGVEMNTGNYKKEKLNCLVTLYLLALYSIVNSVEI